MLLLILGEHDLPQWRQIKEKSGRIFSHPPVGVRVLHHYITLSGKYTFTIIEAEEAKEVETLMTELYSVSTYEVYPIYEVTEGKTKEMEGEYLDPMHGPL